MTSWPGARERRARALERSGRALRSAVRVFPDYAGTVLWFTEGPVDYAAGGVSAELADAMRVWEDDYYAALDAELRWRSSELRRAHAARGLELARALSAEIGDILEVEVTDAAGAKHRVRAPGAGTNSAAVDAFRAMAVRAEREGREQAAAIRAGEASGFVIVDANGNELKLGKRKRNR